MAFPSRTAANEGQAVAVMDAAASAAGIVVPSLSPTGRTSLYVANLLEGDPTTAQIPAGDVLSGTFGANKSGGADTGLYTFPNGLTITAGQLALCASNAANVLFNLGTTATITGANQTGINLIPKADSTNTGSFFGLYVQLFTAAASYTTTNLYGAFIDTASLGAGSAATNNYGLYLNPVTKGTGFNYGIYINAPSGGSTVNTAIKAFPGDIGIQVGSASGGSATTKTAFSSIPIWDATTTANGYSFYANATTAAASFTLTNRIGLYLDNTAKGAGSTITNDYGMFIVGPSQGATINEAIRAAIGDKGLRITGASVGPATTKAALYTDPTVDATTTATYYGLYHGATTAASGFTLTNMYGVYIDAVAKGAGSTITNRYGAYIVGPTDAATINAALWIANGDAVLAGSGSALATNATSGFPMIPTCAGTPSGTPTQAGTGRAAMIYDTTGKKIWVYDQVATGWKAVGVA